jgi:hypothetical protein
MNIDVSAIVIVGVAAVILAIVALALKGKVNVKGKIGHLVEGELQAEEKTPPQATNQSPAGAHVAAGAIKDSKVINADQKPGQGSATTKVDGDISNSTVINVTGDLNIGAALGAASQQAGAAEAAQATAQDPLKKKLAAVLEDRFSLSEIDTLCFDLGIDAENVRGETKPEKARALIDYCARRKMLDKLVSAIKKIRDHTDL